MTEKHTPGPWVAFPPEGRQARWTIWHWTKSKARNWRTWVATIYCGEALNEQEANARLIAAAPEMLAALEILAASPDDTPPAGITQTAWATALSNARAAIAKATGS